jgi:hypothetical protein
VLRGASLRAFSTKFINIFQRTPAAKVPMFSFRLLVLPKGSAWQNRAAVVPCEMLLDAAARLALLVAIWRQLAKCRE